MLRKMATDLVRHKTFQVLGVVARNLNVAHSTDKKTLTSSSKPDVGIFQQVESTR